MRPTHVLANVGTYTYYYYVSTHAKISELALSPRHYNHARKRTDHINYVIHIYYQ